MSKNKYSVYCHTCPNGKRYVGITCQNPNQRWKNGMGYKVQSLFYNAINKYGWENIKHEILFENLTKEQAEQKEIELIIKYKSNEREYGYNIANGGNYAGKHSDESRRKMSVSQTGKKHTEETKAKMSAASMGNRHMAGKVLSKETKTKMSEAHKGKIVGKETRRKLSEANKGKPLSEEHKKRVIETRKNISIVQVSCFSNEQINQYKSMRDAGRQTNINSGNISQCCSGARETAGGFKWKYADRHIEPQPPRIDKRLIPIVQYDLDMNMIKMYNSVIEATKYNGIRNISRAAKNGTTAGGYRWEYA